MAETPVAGGAAAGVVPGAGLPLREAGRSRYGTPEDGPESVEPESVEPGAGADERAPGAALRAPAGIEFGVDCGLAPPGFLRRRVPAAADPSFPGDPTALPIGLPIGLPVGLRGAAPDLPARRSPFAAPDSAASFREELAAVIAEFVGEDAGTAAAAYFAENTGLAGGPSRSTRAIAETTFEHGRRSRPSRERVRQAVARAREILAAAAPNARFRHWEPAVAKARAETPLPLPDFLALFGYAPEEPRPIRLGHWLGRAASLLSLEFPFSFLDGPFGEIWVVSDERDRQAESIRALEWLAALPSAPWHDLATLLPAPWRRGAVVARSVVRRSLRWSFLDPGERYFRRLPDPPGEGSSARARADRNPLLRTLRRQFAFGDAAPRPSVALAAGRARGLRRPVPPPVLTGIAAQSGLFEVGPRAIRRKPGLSWPALSPADRVIAELAAQRPGRALSRRSILETLRATGMTKGTASAEITNSPLLLPASSLPDGRYRFLFGARTLRLPKPD